MSGVISTSIGTRCSSHHCISFIHSDPLTTIRRLQEPFGAFPSECRADHYRAEKTLHFLRSQSAEPIYARLT
jgi:hypothetical protein